jgi:phosphatidylglycerol:prolipoprotein diacylglycerol transferase
VAIMLGFISAMLFQLLFDSLKENSTNSVFSMTFFGGLVGGVITFIIGYFFYIKKRYPECNFTSDVLIIAPACITVAHGFGRIGCFLAGCCYGKQTDSIWGVKFPHLNHNVFPTQLYEAIFLIILASILFLLAYKYKNKYTFVIYLTSYGIFRFLIEFIRGDDRGAFFLSLSPSQVFSIISIIIGITIGIYFKLKNKQINN